MTHLSKTQLARKAAEGLSEAQAQAQAAGVELRRHSDWHYSLRWPDDAHILNWWPTTARAGLAGYQSDDAKLDLNTFQAVRTVEDFVSWGLHCVGQPAPEDVRRIANRSRDEDPEFQRLFNLTLNAMLSNPQVCRVGDLREEGDERYDLEETGDLRDLARTAKRAAIEAHAVLNDPDEPMEPEKHDE